MRDVSLAALRGKISDRSARTYCQGNREVRADIVAGQKVGENTVVLNGDSEMDQRAARAEELRQRELELVAELERAREERIACER